MTERQRVGDKVGRRLRSAGGEAAAEEEEKPIFIYDFPKELKAFYMPINPKDPRTVLASDMLAPHGHGEIIGGKLE